MSNKRQKMSHMTEIDSGVNKPFDEQLQEVNALRQKYYDMQDEMYRLKNKLDKEEIKLQSRCEHKFIAESDGDCHRPSYDYTCKICKYFTKFRPERYEMA
jgi:hypothetical protein